MNGSRKRRPKLGGGRIHDAKPAAARSLFAKTVGRNPLSDAFSQAVWFSRTFRLRVPSACLPFARQLPRRKMDEASAIESPAAFGWKGGALRLIPTGESIWREDRDWSENASAGGTQGGRSGYMYRSTSAQCVHPGPMCAGECARGRAPQRQGRMCGDAVRMAEARLTRNEQH